jgi:ABC-type uncharacterized transport system substrate-binding protein
MFRPTTLLALTVFTMTLAAEDFGPVVKAVNQAYQGKTHYGVVCNYSFSAKEVARLRRALPEGSKLTVVDVRNHQDVGPAATTILRSGVELLALLPSDPLVRDGSAHATALVDTVNDRIPAFGTTPAALTDGCVLAMGAATKWQLMVHPRMLEQEPKGTIGPVVITRILSSTGSGGGGH